MSPKTILAIAVLTIGACDHTDAPIPAQPVVAVEPPAPPPPPPPVIPAAPHATLDNARVIDIAHAAREIEASPEHIDDVLTRHGLDRMNFEIAIAEIAKDGWKSDLYIAALAHPGRS